MEWVFAAWDVTSPEVRTTEKNKTNHRDTEAQRVRRESDNTAILDILGSFWEFWYLLAFPSLYGLDNLKLGTEILTES